MKRAELRPESAPHTLIKGVRRAWPLWVFMLAVGVLEFAGGDAARHALRFDRAAILDGQWWRLLSGHLVHLGAHHMLLNLAALLLGYLLCGDVFDFGRWLLILLGSMLGIGLGLLLFDPGLVWYVGLSGALHGLLAAGALALIRRREGVGWALLVLLVGKLVWEQTAGPIPWTAAASGGPVVVDAHFYGALSGTAMYALLRLWAAGRRTDAAK